MQPRLISLAVRGRCQRAEETLTDIHDQLRAGAITVLDVTDTNQREYAVAATLEVSIAQISHAERERYLELAMFGEDVDIPLDVVVRYWKHAASWSMPRTRILRRALADASLLATYRLDQPPRVHMHDAIRAHLGHLASDRLPGLHAALLDAHRDLVPVPGPVLPDLPHPALTRVLSGHTDFHRGACGRSVRGRASRRDARHPSAGSWVRA